MNIKETFVNSVSNGLINFTTNMNAKITLCIYYLIDKMDAIKQEKQDEIIFLGTAFKTA